MANNVNSGRFFEGGIQDGNQKGFPNITSYFKTTGKRFTAGLTFVAAGMMAVTALLNLLPDLPNKGRGDGKFGPKFSGDRK